MHVLMAQRLMLNRKTQHGTPERLSYMLPCTSLLGLQAEDAVVAVGPLVANHFGAKFALLAWSGAGILKRGRPLCLPP